MTMITSLTKTSDSGNPSVEGEESDSDDEPLLPYEDDKHIETEEYGPPKLVFHPVLGEGEMELVEGNWSGILFFEEPAPKIRCYT